ncbi:hypothetical protein H6F93_07110 [Leptolyngbya sp. FACHB-671]|uniref:hypothetical protein n=1 Tax=Leptolyngbya sp. FACHB-671 TaxID=2692812 RepID=UPI0016865129|nr:hypothetical protein [Leptolyngbya sp. FACHB-671]MBD2067297.1 hypothetical protein [Leptolyngbya sp. FACHB-671]
MPSPGRYQSSVFNFLNRRSLQLSEQIRRTVRSVKTTATWGVQILLYPAYVAFQTGRVTAQQLRQAVQTTSLRLKAVEKAIEKVKHVNAPPRPEPTLSSDTPIYKVLQTVEAFALLPTVKTPLELAASSDLSQLQNQAELTVQAIQIDGLIVRSDAAKYSATEHGATEHSAFGKATEAGIAVSQNGTTNGTISGSSAVNGNGAVSANGTARSLSPSSKIIGIASLLTSRSLVLVTNQSQILDILTTEQQVQLHRRIVWEVAQYWRTRRALWAEQQPVPFPLPLPEVHQNALPPVRLFRRLMAWMQTGSVAIATNLFHESVLVAQLQADQAIAYTHLANFTEPGADDPWTEDDDTSGFIEMTEFSAAMVNPWERRQRATLNPSAATPMRLLKSSRFSGVFPFAGKRQDSPQANAQANPQANRFSRILPSLRTVWSEKRLAQVEDSGRTVAIAPMPPSPETGSALQPCQPDVPGQLDQPNPQSSSDLQTTWIETEATLVGYVKHPLEQFLEWLDSGMVWIEETLAKVWNWLRHGRRS